jgi:hypothetical protein
MLKIRWSLALAAVLLATGCGARSAGREAIIARCLGDGEDPVVCDCLGNQSVKKLDKTGFDLVVLGARGQDAEADSLLAELTPVEQAKLSGSVRDVASACGVKGYLTGR